VADPAPGNMYLYDAITPPLPDGDYRFTVTSSATVDGNPQQLTDQRYFSIDGPRFKIDATAVAGVYPPRNGHGSFHESLPQIALYRRSLPWERELDPGNLIGTPKSIEGLTEPQGALPWLALLLLEDDEYTLHLNMQLKDVVPHDVLQRLGNPNGVTCDAIEVDTLFLQQILPSKDELQLLTHVRQVSIEDRELNAGSSDGFFAVVMSNRLPKPGGKHRACLVSLEERSDLISADPPAVDTGHFQWLTDNVSLTPLEQIGLQQAPDPAVDPDASGDGSSGQGTPGTLFTRGNLSGIVVGQVRNAVGGLGARGSYFLQTSYLVLLQSWQFVADGPGTFHDLMQAVDDAMIGSVAQAGKPVVTDTGHIPVTLDDRAGTTQQAWYRGPLVPYRLTRDTAGPYHSADQARRVTPDTGAEDISYAAAFEIGRLMAAADARLAQELMRWRREAYKQSSRLDSLNAILTRYALNVPVSLEPFLDTAAVPILVAGVLQEFASNAGPLSDPYGVNNIANVAGLQPDAVQQAWQLGSIQEARDLLGGSPAPLGRPVTVPQRQVSTVQTIDQVAADTALLAKLSGARTRVLDNAQRMVEGGG
jgi:hypothetical protein